MKRFVTIQQRHNTVIVTEEQSNGWEKRWFYFKSTEEAKQAKKLVKAETVAEAIYDKLEYIAYSCQKLTDKQVVEEIAKGWRKA